MYGQSMIIVLIFSSISGGLEYYKARHGFDGRLGWKSTDNITIVPEKFLDNASTIDQVAVVVKNQYNYSIGFTLHPNYPSPRYVGAVIWYTNRSPQSSSWPLYLWNRREANKLSPWVIFLICYTAAIAAYLIIRFIIAIYNYSSGENELPTSSESETELVV